MPIYRRSLSGSTTGVYPLIDRYEYRAAKITAAYGPAQGGKTFLLTLRANLRQYTSDDSESQPTLLMTQKRTPAQQTGLMRRS
jgi:hypothetical protein